MKRSFTVALVLICAATLIAAGGPRSGKQDPARDNRAVGPQGPMPPRVVNEVVELLDEDVFLSSESDELVWRSGIVDTSQFTRVVLRASGETSDFAYIACGCAWRFSPDDEFRMSGPLTTVPEISLAAIRPRWGYPDFGTGGSEEIDPIGRPDGIPDLPVQRPDLIGYTDMGEVRGTELRVVCDLRGQTVLIGDDRSLEPEPAPRTGTLTDVRVLLRRY